MAARVQLARCRPLFAACCLLSGRKSETKSLISCSGGPSATLDFWPQSARKLNRRPPYVLLQDRSWPVRLARPPRRTDTGARALCPNTSWKISRPIPIARNNWAANAGPIRGLRVSGNNSGGCRTSLADIRTAARQADRTSDECPRVTDRRQARIERRRPLTAPLEARSRAPLPTHSVHDWPSSGALKSEPLRRIRPLEKRGASEVHLYLVGGCDERDARSPDTICKGAAIIRSG